MSLGGREGGGEGGREGGGEGGREGGREGLREGGRDGEMEREGRGKRGVRRKHSESNRIPGHCGLMQQSWVSVAKVSGRGTTHTTGIVGGAGSLQASCECGAEEEGERERERERQK